MVNEEPWYFQTLSDVCRDLKSGAKSSVELTGAVLQRIADLSPDTACFARIMSKQALLDAAALDERRAQGLPLGPLHGVPIAVKDLLYTHGVATASGTLVMEDFIPEFDATAVMRLKEAGAVIVGKTQLTEGAFGNHHPDIRVPVNPWDADAWSGVSSSGSGVAVASGMVFAALGSDTGGSIRFPSASCGLVGLKPTYGRVSLHGAFPLAGSLDHIGPMTRSVEDAARLLGVLAGFDRNDPGSVDAPVPNYLAALGAAHDLDGLRIGVDWNYVSQGVHPDVVSVTEAALASLQQLGAKVVKVTVPDEYAELAERWVESCGRECAQAHHAAGYYPAQKHRYGPVLSALIELGLSVADSEYNALEALRVQFGEKLETMLQDLDAMVSPCMPIPTPSTLDMEGGAPSDGSTANFLTFTAPFDYSGHPTLTLPMSMESSLMPGSFQLIGARLNEAMLLRIGAAFESRQNKIEYPDL